MHQHPFLNKTAKLSFLALSTSLLISGCNTQKEKTLSESDKQSIENMLAKSQNSSRAEVAQALDLLYKGEYKQASTYLNTSLMDDPKNPALHFLNGLAYHMLSEKGRGDYTELAIEGYMNALRLDPTNWQASEQLGRIFLRQKRYDLAQEAFADVLLYNQDNVDAYHNLAVSSYYAQDVPRALAYVRVAVKKDPRNIDYLRSASLIAAAAQEPEMARDYFERYKTEEPDPAQERYLEKRMKEWNQVYESGYIDRLIVKHEKEEALRVAEEKRQKKLAEQEAKRQAEYERQLQEQYYFQNNADGVAYNTQGEQNQYASASIQGQQLSNQYAQQQYMQNVSSQASGQSTTLTPPPVNAPQPNVPAPKPPAAAPPQTAAPAVAPPPVTAPAPTPPATAAPRPAAPALATQPSVSPDAQKAIAKPPAAQASAADGLSDQMVLLDGVVMRVSEEGTTNKGNNILENLTVAATLRNTNTNTVNHNDPAASSNAKQYQRVRGFNFYHALAAAGSVPLTNPLLYSLNLASAFKQYVEVIGRPTLAVTVGKEGDFYSGDDRWLPLKGDRGGNVEKIPIGIGLTVTPIKIEGDTVTLKVAMQGRSVLREPTVTSTSFSVVDQYLILASSYVKTEIKAKIGETVVLAGIKLRSDVQGKGGFPVLQDIPGVQYFFSQEETNSQRRTVLYMLTVRGYGKDIQGVNDTLRKERIDQPSVSELDERHFNWFRPRSNTLAMLRTLAPVYREFRTGDLSPVDWMMDDNAVEQLVQASSFLYY